MEAPGVELVRMDASSREDPHPSDGAGAASAADGDPSRTRTVASLATALEDALAKGDRATALALVEELRRLVLRDLGTSGGMTQP